MIEVQMAVTEAIVYQRGALVTREAEIEMAEGENHIVIENLPSSITKESIQVITPPNVRIQKVEYVKNKLDGRFEEEMGKEYVEKIAELQKAVEKNQAKSQDAALKKRILENVFLQNQCQINSAKELREYMEVLKKDLEEVFKESEELESAKRKTEEEILQLTEEMRKEEFEFKKTPGHIKLDTEADKTGIFRIKIVYYDKKASWLPHYDIKAKDVNSPVNITLKGKISQDTGEDWMGIMLTLSTGNVNISNNQPELKTWLLRKQESFWSHQGARAVMPMAPMPPMHDEVIAEGGETTLLSDPHIYQDHTEELQKTMAMEFSLSGKYDVSDDAKDSIIIVAEKTFHADYIYSAIPKAEQNVYLKAVLDGKDADWLLECDANVFFENSFIGAVHILPDRLKDNFELSLGRDKAVVTKRERKKAHETIAKLGNTKKAFREYELLVQNRKNEQVYIEVYDQIPVSTDPSIIVEPVELSGAELKEDNGQLKWKYTIEPHEEVKTELKFNISYPKNESINI